MKRRNMFVSDDLNVGKNLVINVGSGPAIKFNKSDGTLFTIGDFDISAWPLKLLKVNIQYMGGITKD